MGNFVLLYRNGLGFNVHFFSCLHVRSLTFGLFFRLPFKYTEYFYLSFVDSQIAQSILRMFGDIWEKALLTINLDPIKIFHDISFAVQKGLLQLNYFKVNEYGTLWKRKKQFM